MVDGVGWTITLSSRVIYSVLSTITTTSTCTYLAGFVALLALEIRVHEVAVIAVALGVPVESIWGGGVLLYRLYEKKLLIRIKSIKYPTGKAVGWGVRAGSATGVALLAIIGRVFEVAILTNLTKRELVVGLQAGHAICVVRAAGALRSTARARGGEVEEWIGTGCNALIDCNLNNCE